MSFDATGVSRSDDRLLKGCGPKVLAQELRRGFSIFVVIAANAILGTLQLATGRRPAEIGARLDLLR